MTTPSAVPPVSRVTVQPAPEQPVDPEIVATARRLSGLKTRTANFGRNVVKPLAIGAVGGLVVAVANRKSKDSDTTENDDTVINPDE